MVTVCNREGDIGEAGGEGESDCDPDEGEIPIATEPLSEVDPDQTQFTKIDYSKATKSEKIAALLSYIRYARKNNKSVKLDEIFKNMPTYGSHGDIYDVFSSSIKFGTRVVPVSRIEIPLQGSGITDFNSIYSEHKDVTTPQGPRTNIYFRVPCSGCVSSSPAFMIQVMRGDLEFMLNFFRGD